MRTDELAHIVRQALNDVRDTDGEPGYLLDVTPLPEWDGEAVKVTVNVLGDDNYAGGDRFEITVAKKNYVCLHPGHPCR